MECPTAHHILPGLDPPHILRAQVELQWPQVKPVIGEQNTNNGVSLEVVLVLNMERTTLFPRMNHIQVTENRSMEPA